MNDPSTLTFAQRDELERDRAARRVAIEERLVRLFDRFSASDLAFLWTVDGPDLTLIRAALQRARAAK